MQDTLDFVRLCVQRFCSKQDGAHDWGHITRVERTALAIAHREGGDKELVQLAALVHDVGDAKSHGGDAEKGRREVEGLLHYCMVKESLATRALEIAMNVSFKGADIPDNMPTLEGKIVQDADRLEAIGAIAVARTFTWGGANHRSILDSIAFFNSRLLLLQDRLHTPTARAIAMKRQMFMERFLEQFMQEWNGVDVLGFTGAA